MKQIRVVIIIVGLFFIYSCSNKDNYVHKSDFESLSSSLYLLEESNRIVFKNLIQDYHLNDSNSNYLNKSFIEVYNFIDTLTENLLVKSGGYDKTGALIGGTKKNVGLKLIKKHDFISKTKEMYSEIVKKSQELNLPFYNEANKDLKSALYPIISYWNYDIIGNKTVAELYLDLIIIQNRLLVSEVKYYELIQNK